MSHFVKAAALVVAVVVVVVVLGGGCGGKFVAAQGATECKPDTEIRKSGKEKIIPNEKISPLQLPVHRLMYMMLLTDFEGVRAEVKTSIGIFPVWLPIMEHCSRYYSQWWPVLLVVKKHRSLTFNVTLRVHNRLLSRELTTRHTSGEDLKLHTIHQIH